MNEKLNLESDKTASSWDTYWQGDQSSPAFSSSGVNHQEIEAFWQAFFRTMAERYQSPKMVDIASGNGALAEAAFAICGDNAIDISCVDISAAAIANITNRFPAIHGVVSDARAIPLAPASFDIVSSQFGVEYAGMEAIDQAIKLVAANGTLGFLLHYSGGKISSECAENLHAIEVLQNYKFVETARTMFKAGFDAMAGNDRGPYDQAANQLAEILPFVENLIEEHGENIAGGTVLKLYNDIGKIHSKLQNYDAAEVLNWLAQMQNELAAYQERMQSMLSAAIDQQSFDEIRAKLDAAGFSLQQQQLLLEKQTESPLAWMISARKDRAE